MASTLKSLFKPAAEALRTYWPAMLVIQLVALGVVVSYYRMDAAADVFAWVARLKQEGGLVFAAVSTLISGGVIPEILKRCFRPENIKPPGAAELAHQGGLWIALGILVDRFYHLQGVLFGHGTDAVTLLIKVAFDQLVFTPLVSMPFTVLWFMLYEARYHPGRWVSLWSLRRIVSRVMPLWVTCLSFWPVMLLIIYSLPAELQFPLFLFGNSAYSIFMIFIARRQTGEKVGEG